MSSKLYVSALGGKDGAPARCSRGLLARRLRGEIGQRRRATEQFHGFRPLPHRGPAVEARADDRHLFWPCDLSALDTSTIDRDRVHGPRQVTDAYLLALAVAHGGRLVTFDRSVPMSAVRSAGEQHLAVV